MAGNASRNHCVSVQEVFINTASLFTLVIFDFQQPPTEPSENYGTNSFGTSHCQGNVMLWKRTAQGQYVQCNHGFSRYKLFTSHDNGELANESF